MVILFGKRRCGKAGDPESVKPGWRAEDRPAYG
jgi:hypothetical protein